VGLLAELQLVGAGGITAAGWGWWQYFSWLGWWQNCIWLGLAAGLLLVGAGGKSAAVWAWRHNCSWQLLAAELHLC
jgi:hypothetical protein